MRAESWLSAPARRELAGVVRAIEARSAAEIVITVRARSGTYRHVDVAFGAGLAATMLAIYAYAPLVFTDDLAPPAILVSFVAGVLLAGSVDPLKRALLGRGARQAMVRMAARAAFVDQGIASTVARTGVLVYVSLFEREVEVVADTGVDVSRMGAAWSEAVAALEARARGGISPEDFGAALTRLGDPLAEAMPPRPDDTNELPDEVVT
jgi:putative membrane protein